MDYQKRTKLMLIYLHFEQLLTLPVLLIGKFLSSLLQPLTHNDYNLKDSFDAVKRIRSIPPELFDNGYQFVSFDVQSLFTNVPVKKAINIILDRVYNKKLINTNLKKRTMKKLLVDSCTKTAFSFDNVLYELCGVSMGSPLGQY